MYAMMANLKGKPHVHVLVRDHKYQGNIERVRRLLTKLMRSLSAEVDLAALFGVVAVHAVTHTLSIQHMSASSRSSICKSLT